MACLLRIMLNPIATKTNRLSYHLSLSLSVVDYLIESEPIINKFISVPKDKGVLNCAAFISGIIEAILIESNFVSF